MRFGPRGARIVDAGSRSRRSATRVSSHRRRRSPTCARRSTSSFADDPTQPWECVRGMDQSFGYNARVASRALPDARASCCGCFTDIVSKGGNLLLNVGPRGSTRRSPTSSGCGWTGSATGSAEHGARCDPTVGPAGDDDRRRAAVRYTARDDAGEFTFVDPGPGRSRSPTWDHADHPGPPRVRWRGAVDRDHGRTADRGGIGRHGG